MPPPAKAAAVALALAMVGAGCGDDGVQPDQATHVLSKADNRQVELALEGLAAWCYDDLAGVPNASRIARSAVRDLEQVATEQPHAIYNGRGNPVTMVQLLEGMPGTYDDCGYAQDLGDLADELRGKSD